MSIHKLMKMYAMARSQPARQGIHIFICDGLIDILNLRGDYAVKDNSYPEEPPIRPIHSVEDLKYNLDPKNSKKTNRESKSLNQTS
ncbi:MAG: hypothetical protein KL787_10015 [Taibaiella sp.]|nr:hypothetical protein [Taibaiella sp.]